MPHGPVVKRLAAVLAVLSLTLITLLAWSGVARAAEGHRYPADTLRVRVAPYTSQTLLIDGVEIYLSPGARIFSADNRTIVPGRVPTNAIARVQPNDRGEIKALWILTPEEIAEDVPDSDRVHVTPIRQ